MGKSSINEGSNGNMENDVYIFFRLSCGFNQEKKGPGGFRVFIGTLLMEYEGEYF